MRNAADKAARALIPDYRGRARAPFARSMLHWCVRAPRGDRPCRQSRLVLALRSISLQPSIRSAPQCAGKSRPGMPAGRTWPDRRTSSPVFDSEPPFPTGHASPAPPEFDRHDAPHPVLRLARGQVVLVILSRTQRAARSAKFLWCVANRHSATGSSSTRPAGLRAIPTPPTPRASVMVGR